MVCDHSDEDHNKAVEAVKAVADCVGSVEAILCELDIEHIVSYADRVRDDHKVGVFLHLRDRNPGLAKYYDSQLSLTDAIAIEAAARGVHHG